MKSILRILLTLISVLAPWIIGVATVQAALLNDIRVGDYDTHTRIVFELSEATVFERIISRKPGQLTIIFPNAKPQLVRKIPTERSARVEEITIFRRQDSLSVVLAFSFEHFRYELKEYENPFRLVIDVFHLDVKPTSKHLPDEANSVIETRDDSWRQDQPASLSEQDPFSMPQSSAEVANPRPNQEALKLPAAEQPKSDRPALPHLTQPEKHQTEPVTADTDDGSPSADASAPTANGMQFYLVIGMVIMTIVILILLLLMLIFKQPKSEGNALSVASKDLHQQDKHIATLNAKIHEQLKRYDEA